MNPFVARPQMALALNLMLVLAGILSFLTLPVRHEPNVISKTISIETRYNGAQAKIIEDEISEPIEEVLATIDGIRDIYSESADGNSYITLKLDDSADYNKVSADVKDVVARISAYLPKQAEKPKIYEKAKQDSVVAYLTLTSTEHNYSELYELSKNLLRQQLLMVGGVAKVEVWGSGERYINVAADPIALAQYGLTLESIVEVLNKEKTFASGGKIKTFSGTKNIIIDSPFTSLKQIQKIPIITGNDGTIELGNLASISIEELDEEYENLVDGKKQVILGVIAKLTANPISVVNKVESWAKGINSQTQQGLKIEMVVDKTQPLKDNINGVGRSIIEAIAIVIIIVSISLKSLRLSMIPNLIIVMCLISTFSIVKLFGFSINPIVLLALVVSVGLIVDDSIVVIESIYRRVELGEDLLTATNKSLKDISFAVIVMTLSIAAVYVPLAFQSGKNAVIFREFAWTLSGAVLISGIMALTLVPALINRVGQIKAQESRFWTNIQTIYGAYLQKIIPHFYKVLFFFAILLIVTGYFFNKMPYESRPPEENGMIVGRVMTKNAITPALKEQWKLQLVEILDKNPNVKNHLVQSFQPNMLQWIGALVPRTERSDSDADVGNKIKETIENKIQGPKSEFFMQSNSGDDSLSLELDIYYKDMNSQLMDQLDNFLENMEALPGVASASSSELDKKLRYLITVDRALLSKLGINITDLQKQLFTFFEGVETFKIHSEDNKFKVIVSGSKEASATISSLNNFFIYDDEQNPIPLGGLIDVKEQFLPEIISHANTRKVITVVINFVPGIDFDDGVQTIKTFSMDNIPSSVAWDVSGKYTSIQEYKRTMYLTFFLCLVFIFLIFAMLFNSFIEPFIVMFTVPISIFGAVLLVYSMGGTNNFYFQIAIITLVGLISKHGVFIVDTANRLLQSGQPLFDATVNAAKQRLRPILITTLAMLSGAIPLLYSLTIDSVGQKHIAWVILGGLTSETIFSLFIIPVIYFKVKQRFTQNLD